MIPFKAVKKEVKIDDIINSMRASDDWVVLYTTPEGMNFHIAKSESLLLLAKAICNLPIEAQKILGKILQQEINKNDN